MNLRILIFTILSFLLISNTAGAQSANDYTRLKSLFPVEIKGDKIRTDIDFSNELTLVLTAGFNFYKKFVSPQDAMHCSFEPSCSVYALQTIKTNGLLGVFDAIDRLTRCNGFSPEKYTIDQTTHRLYDPVKKIH